MPAIRRYAQAGANADPAVKAAAQDILISELVKKGKYTVIDRERLSEVLQEKNLSISGDIDPKTAVKAGKLLGVEYVIAGSVTEFGSVKSGASKRAVSRIGSTRGDAERSAPLAMSAIVRHWRI